ncbi:MAG: AAA family ATPase [Microbacterium arborescens]
MIGRDHGDAVAPDELAAALRELRSAHGSPSYEEIRRRIGRDRSRRGIPHTPGRVTVYDCFRAGRARLDAELVHDIVLALTGDEDEAQTWRRRSAARAGDDPVSASILTPTRSPGAAAPLPPPGVVTVITGLPGVGKSTLARELAERARSAGAVERVVHVPARGYHPAYEPAAPAALLRAVAAAMGVRDASRGDLGAVAAALSRTARDRATAVIVDDVRSADGLTTLLAADVHWIVTSRSRLPELEAAIRTTDSPRAHRVRRHELAPLSPDDAARLIGDAWEAPVDPAALAALAETSGGIRLSIELIVRFARDHADWSAEDVAHYFRTAGSRDALHPLLDTLYRDLSGEEALVLRTLAVIGAPVPLEVVDEALRPASRTVPRLIALHLLEHEGGTLRMHDTVTAFARERSEVDDPASARRERIARVADALRVVVPRPLSRSAADLTAATAVAARRAGAQEALVRLAVDLGPALEEAGHWGEMTTVLEHAGSPADDADRALIAEHLARAYEMLGRIDESLAALHRARRAGAERMPGRLWNVIGNLQRHLGRLDHAEAAYRKAADTASAADNPVTLGRALGNLANLARITGDLADSEALFDEAGRVSADAGDEVNLSILRANRIHLDLDLGRTDAALEASTTLLEAAPPTPSPLAIRLLRARSLAAAGDAASADDLLADVDPDTHTSFDAPIDALVLRAAIRLRLRHLDAAEADARRALADAERLDVALPVPDALCTIAEIALARGDAELAHEHALAAAESAAALGDRHEIARSHVIRGDAAARLGLTERARAELRIGHDILRSMGHIRAREVSAKLAALADDVRERSG